MTLMELQVRLSSYTQQFNMQDAGRVDPHFWTVFEPLLLSISESRNLQNIEILYNQCLALSNSFAAASDVCFNAKSRLTAAPAEHMISTRSGLGNIAGPAPRAQPRSVFSTQNLHGSRPLPPLPCENQEANRRLSDEGLAPSSDDSGAGRTKSESSTKTLDEFDTRPLPWIPGFHGSKVANDLGFLIPAEATVGPMSRSPSPDSGRAPRAERTTTGASYTETADGLTLFDTRPLGGLPGFNGSRLNEPGFPIPPFPSNTPLSASSVFSEHSTATHEHGTNRTTSPVRPTIRSSSEILLDSTTYSSPTPPGGASRTPTRRVFTETDANISSADRNGQRLPISNSRPQYIAPQPYKTRYGTYITNELGTTYRVRMPTSETPPELPSRSQINAPTSEPNDILTLAREARMRTYSDISTASTTPPGSPLHYQINGPTPDTRGLLTAAREAHMRRMNGKTSPSVPPLPLAQPSASASTSVEYRPNRGNSVHVMERIEEGGGSKGGD
ncbi:hypothetical protein K470DRAFT_257632 [Piedraia hortae CBS 480.64]|uniref:Uncharacterized protein n=1 Tax=Piedraia hortae CBS 480.64 TaxID=1314780 RepID=A0A6A7C0D8_9PEZI|nr:hypothetical protein K470DRAFT_257632 [Piedraia hortae CBS 480.64]